MNTTPSRNASPPPRRQMVHAAAAPRIAGLRLAHLILDMGFGGAERLAQTLAIAMENRGAQCRILCFDAITDNVEPLLRHGIPVELIKRRQTPFDPLACLRLVKRIKALDLQLLHAHDLASLAYAVTAAALLGLPVVMTEHSRHYIDARPVRRLEKRLLCRGVRRLVAVSPELAHASLAKDGVAADKLLVIENGVDIERFAAADGRVPRMELGLCPEALLIGMVGRLEEIKGPDVLLEAFARLARAYPVAALAFIGEGSLKEDLRGRAKALGLSPRTHFLGARPDIPEIMAGLDVLVLPSRSEGLPFALLEGMAAGRAVAATSVGRMPPIVAPSREEPNGLLVPPDNADALAAALGSLLADASLRQRLGCSARNYVTNHYDQRSMCAAYQEVYLQTLAERP